MEETYFKKILTSLILLALLVLSFFLIRPILMALITGLILSFIFYPVYSKLNKYLKIPTLSSAIVCVLLILIIAVPLWFLSSLILDQFLNFYSSIQQINLLELFTTAFPSLSMDSLPEIVGTLFETSMNKIVNSIADSLTLNNIMGYALKSFVVFFTLFFVLRDREKMSSYIKSLSPFPKDIEKKLFDSSKAITSAVIYGQVIVGILQGLILGAGLLIFQVPNALLFTLLACLAGIFPIIGTIVVWVPVSIYLFVAGQPIATFGVLIFGIISSSLDNLLRPIIVSKRTNINSLLILVGMIGGLFLFGVMGFILGPLILAYLLIILELYRNKKIPSILMEEAK